MRFNSMQREEPYLGLKYSCGYLETYIVFEIAM